MRQALHKSIASAINSARLSEGSSGLVFAGFGEEEFFPSLVNVVTGAAIGDVVKTYTKRHIDAYRAGVAAKVLPFAQSEMVGRFMNGVDSEFMADLRRIFESSLVKVAREVLGTNSQAGQLTEQQKPELLNIVQSNLAAFEEATQDFGDSSLAVQSWT